jgi:hypothetical protein
MIKCGAAVNSRNLKLTIKLILPNEFLEFGQVLLFLWNKFGLTSNVLAVLAKR